MLDRAASHMDLISEHLYWQDKPDVPAHVAQVPADIRRVADAHRAYRRELLPLAGRDIRVALDEWNYWYGPNEYGELGTRYFLQDALGIAAGLHELFRNSDVFWMANYAQTVNVIGAIKTTKTEAEIDATGLVLALYRRQFGTLPLRVSGDAAPLDVAAALTPDRTTITIAVVNPTAETRSVKVDLQRARTGRGGQRFVLTGSGRWAYNAPGRTPGVTVEQRSVSQASAAVESPPLSITLHRLALE